MRLNNGLGDVNNVPSNSTYNPNDSEEFKFKCSEKNNCCSAWMVFFWVIPIL
jgi:hypothetical protein